MNSNLAVQFAQQQETRQQAPAVPPQANALAVPQAPRRIGLGIF